MALSVLQQRMKAAWLAVFAVGLLVALCFSLEREVIGSALAWVAAVLLVWALRETRCVLSATRFGRVGRYWFPGGHDAG